jgi:2-haloacid dehalogenase
VTKRYASSVIDFQQITHLTFDCYGTLVDWESGILSALGPVLAGHGVPAPDEHLLRLFTKFEAEEEAGSYRPYREVLRNVMAGIGASLGFKPSTQDLSTLPDSVKDWLPFPDSVAALAILKRRFRLAIISNVDDALFAATASRLEVGFEDVITAQQVRSYKPARRNFRAALMRLGVAPRRVLHVAQSLFHDHVPAHELGFPTVWVKRPSRLGATGLALRANVRPDLEVPDLRTLAAIVVDAFGRSNTAARC